MQENIGRSALRIFFHVSKAGSLNMDAKTICHGGGMNKAVCAAKGERHDQLD